jgi:hypothetical protein
LSSFTFRELTPVCCAWHRCIVVSSGFAYAEKKDWLDFASGTGGWRIGYKVEIIDFGASTNDSNKLLTHSKVECYTSSGYAGSEMAVLEFADCKGVRAQIYVSDNDSPIAK